MALPPFGWDQRKNPTPSNIIMWFVVINSISWGFQGWLHTATIVGPHWKDIITQLNSLLMIILTALAPMFGVNLGNAKYVKASDVSAVDVPTETK